MIHKLFFRRIDAASLAVFRMMLGALILFEAVNYGVFLCLECMYRDTELLFKYHYFEWVSLPPEPWLRVAFALLGVAAIGVMTGTFYRLSIIVVTVIFTFHFLLDQALYLNHFYLVILFCIIMCFAPAERLWSVDAWRKPSLRSESIPAWSRFWLGAQLEIILIYAGLVKINHDWLNLEPMRQWMTKRSQDEGVLLQWLTQDWGIAAASYGVIILHLVGAPLLLWRRTRLAVFIIYGLFHLSNAFVFNIGIFPFVTMAATLLLFDPDWPRQVLRWWDAQKPLRSALFKSLSRSPRIVQAPEKVYREHRGIASLLIVSLISVWLVLQIVIPLRHFALPGNVAWNEDGHRFSWRMKLRTKQGIARFVVVLPDGTRIIENPARRLNVEQATKMVCIPDLIWQYARYLETVHSATVEGDVQVFARVLCSLNDREPARLIDERVDLTSIPRTEPVTRWVLPLDIPLRHAYF